MPPQHRVWADQEPEPTQHCTRQRHQQHGEEHPVLGPKSRALVTELSLQDGQLMAQGEDLDVPLAVGHRQERQRREHMDNGEIDEANQHETRSCRTASGHPPMTP